MYETVSLYDYLNRHLYTTEKVIETVDDVQETCSFIRNPPRFLLPSEVTKNIFINKWKFTDEVFERPHTVIFAKMKQGIKHIGSGRVSIIDGRSPCGFTFYHFMTETLPSVIFINNPNLPILCKPTPGIIPYLQWFGINNQIIFEMSPIKDLVYQKYIDGGWTSPHQLQILREIVEKKVTFNPSIGILICRSSGVRQTVNHSDVLVMLKRKYADLDWYVFDRQGVDEAADLFSRAKIVVAGHGAGLTNTIFSPKGTSILEFVHEDDPNPCFWNQSEVLGHIHYLVPTRVDERFNFIVDTEALYQVLPAIV